jgi:Beta-propeller repeat/Domain of unknown function DUF11
MENSEELLKLNFRSLRLLTRRIPLILAALLIGISLFRLDAGKALGGENALSRSRRTAVSSEKFPQNALQIASIYGHLPLSFEPNQGQTDPQVKFLARGGGYGLYLTESEAVLALHARGEQNSIIRMSLDRANRGEIVDAQEELPGKSNYFIGNDPANWHRNIPQFARVRYHDVYPGIDLVYYGHQGKLEYDFEVSPGADPKQIALEFQGSPRLTLTAAGDLSIATEAGKVQLQAPRVYQQIGDEDRAIAGKFVLLSDNQVAFEIGAYDRTKRLVIDPILTYSTYLGGSGDESCSKIENLASISTAQFTPGCPAVAVDAAFRTYVAGATTSTDFPGVAAGSGFQKCLDTPPPNPTSPVSPSPCPSGLSNSDVFVVRFNAAGTGLDFATYLGGSGTDVTGGIAVDANFNVHLAGTTNSSNFPTLLTSFQPTPLSAGTHVFVSELAAGGASLLYSTYLSGNGTDIAAGLAIDNLGKEYVTGTTNSSNFPTTATALQTAPKAASQSFFTKLDPTINGPGALLYSSYIGGSAPATGVMVGGGVAVDSNCNAYLTGGTNFTDLPTLNAPQGTNLGGLDAWVAKFSVPTGSSCGSLLSLTYMTYLGGSGDDVGYGIAVDTGFSAYITGSTTSPDIVLPGGSTNPAPFARCLDTPPPASGPYPIPPCPSNGTAADAFVAKFGSLTTGTTGTNVPYLYFTYLGGTGADTGTAIAADTIGGAFVTGWTASSDFPTAILSGTPVQSPLGGGEDAFVARIDTTTICASNPPTVVCPGFTSYLGGNGTDIGTGIALDSGSSTYVTGETASTNFPVVKPFQASLNGPTDAFVTKLGSVGSLQITPTAPTTIGVGNSVAFIYTLINTGDATSGIIVTDALPSTGATFNSIATTVGNCGTVVTSTVTCSIGTLNSGGTATITVNLTPTAPVTPLTSPGGLSNSIAASAPGSQTVTASSTAAVQDFNIAVQPGTPATITVPAGVPANFTIQVTGTLSNFPDSISLSVGAGLPSATSTAWTTNPIPSLTGSAQTTVLTVTTTARVTTTGFLGHRGALYAIWLPVSGMAFLGLGIGGRVSRKRRILLGLMLTGFFSLVFFQAGCGSSSTTSTTTGTPAGTYTLTVNATSGTATRTTTVTLIVQ